MAFQMHIQIPYFTGIPTDVITNVLSFNFVTLAPTATDWGKLVTRLTAFYAAVYANTAGSIGMAPWVNDAATRFRGYDLTDPVPRAPKYDVTTNLGITNIANSAIPPEMAICISFQGSPLSGVPQARRRGRLYLGGIGSALDSTGSTAFPTLNSARRTGLGNAASSLLTGATIDGWTWGVWSKTDNQLVPIVGGWVDDAPDTQRRRGNAPTSRTTWG